MKNCKIIKAILLNLLAIVVICINLNGKVYAREINYIQDNITELILADIRLNKIGYDSVFSIFLAFGEGKINIKEMQEKLKIGFKKAKKYQKEQMKYNDIRSQKILEGITEIYIKLWKVSIKEVEGHIKKINRVVLKDLYKQMAVKYYLDEHNLIE